MDVNRARELLDLKHSELSDIDIIKRKYRIKALIYHPDKNKSIDACDQFRQIHEAYQLLSNNRNTPSTRTYKDILSDFLKSNDTDGELFNMLLNRISQTCEEKALRFLNTVDNQMLINIHRFIDVYADMLHISKEFVNDVYKLIKKDECIVLNPKLTDMMSDNLYKLTVNDQLYIIPLWHRKLLYDNYGSDLYVVCQPILPDNVTIDEMNNISVNLTYNVLDLFGKSDETFRIGDSEFTFNVSNIRLVENNTIVLKNSGLSRINTNEIYDVSNRGDIILNVRLQ